MKKNLYYWDESIKVMCDGKEIKSLADVKFKDQKKSNIQLPIEILNEIELRLVSWWGNNHEFLMRKYNKRKYRNLEYKIGKILREIDDIMGHKRISIKDLPGGKS